MKTTRLKTLLISFVILFVIAGCDHLKTFKSSKERQKTLTKQMDSLRSEYNKCEIEFKRLEEELRKRNLNDTNVLRNKAIDSPCLRY